MLRHLWHLDAHVIFEAEFVSRGGSSICNLSTATSDKKLYRQGAATD